MTTGRRNSTRWRGTREVLSSLSFLAMLGVAAATAAENILKNGSFEGCLLYWHNVDPRKHRLVRGRSPVGRYRLRLEDGWVMSAPFRCQKGKPFTVSFFVKGDRDGQVSVQLSPSAREVGQKARRLWCREGRQAARVTTQWQRVSFTAKADVPQTGFWPYPHYMVLIEGNVPLEVDGVTVTLGPGGTDGYVPRREVEILTDCPALPGYRTSGNLLEKGATIRLTAHVSNPGEKPRRVTVRWQLVDYEGTEPLCPPVEKRLGLAPGATVSETVPVKLSATGCVLARTSVWAEGKELDRSDLPLTSLPFPFGPRRPEPRERFGGSYFGPHSATLASRIGFGWSRWYPGTKWHLCQPDGPDSWRWADKELDLLESLGISTHIVLCGFPKWMMDRGNPLPRDMRWPPDDPRWDDLTVTTAWDRFVSRVAEHYKGRAVIYEIENEPEFDHWDKLKDRYARFTIRTARLIKRADPRARVMVNNVYAIPSALNRHLLERGGGRFIDIISWHDYREGWLADAMAIRRMRAALDGLRARHVEIWFNEGWAFTNTAVDEPPACTRLTSAQSTNAMVASVAQMTVAGQEKTILFHTGYETHGMSFWDYSGPGTMLWDWYGYPLPLVAAWNTLCYHIGLSEKVALVRPPGASLCVFHDLRHNRGVAVAYADRSASADIAVELPLDEPVVEDIMGNARPLPGGKLTLSRTGRPVYFYSRKPLSGKQLGARLEPLDRRHAGFVFGDTFRLPPVWEGQRKGAQDGNPATSNGQPVWRLDQIWPPDPTSARNYRPMVWRDGWWVPTSNSFGDQPKAEMRDGRIRLEFRARHGKPPAERFCGLVFIVPSDGRYAVSGKATLRLWDGSNPVRLTFLHKTKDKPTELASIRLKPKATVPIVGFAADARAGDELVVLPRIEGMYTGGDVVLSDLVVTRNPAR